MNNILKIILLLFCTLSAQYTGYSKYNSYIQQESAFSPLSISGLVAWYDAQDESTVLRSDGAHPTWVTGWTDKSGNNYHLNQVNNVPLYSSSTLINGKQAIEFVAADGNDFLYRRDILGFSGNPAMTIIVVLDQSSTSDRFFFIGNGTGGQGLALQTDASYRYNNGYQSFPATSTEPVITMWWLDGGQSYNDGHLSYDNVEQSQVAASDNTLAFVDSFTVVGGALPVGNAFTSYGLDGYIGEVIIYNAALSTSERNNLYNYLSSKWLN